MVNAFVSFFGISQCFFSNSSLGSEKLKQNRHSLIKSRLTDLNNFIRKRVTAKSNDFTSLLFNGQHSKPYNKIGTHLHLTNSRTRPTSSEGGYPSNLSKNSISGMKKNPRLASSNEHLSDLDLTKCTRGLCYIIFVINLFVLKNSISATIMS